LNRPQTKQIRIITILAVAGVLISTFVFGTAIYLVLVWLNLNLNYTWCLLFGALISFATSPSSTSFLASQVIREAVASAAWPSMSKKVT
jgi:NhaP-type Na+/H+ or K+/H+ antiporter